MAKRKNSDAVTVVPRGVGRPDEYDQALFDELIERLSSGEPLAAICRDDRMPSLRTAYRWKERNDENSARFAHARDDGFDAIAADTLTIVDMPPERILTEQGDKIDPGYVGWQKNRVEQRLKLLAKWDPKRYGDKLAIGGADDLPAVQTNATVTLDPSEAYKRLIGGAK